MFVDGKGWVCLDGTQVVGFSCGRLGAGDVWALFVDSKYEKRGIGAQLMELVENWMFSTGCQEITLTTGKPASMLSEKEIRFCLRSS